MITAVSNNTQKQSFGALFLSKPTIANFGEMEIKSFRDKSGIIRKLVTTNADGSIFTSFRNKNKKPVKTVFWSKIGDEVVKIITKFNKDSEITKRVKKINGKVTEISH